MTLFLVKFLLSPVCVVLVSLAGRRWGVKVAGTLGSLPVVGGPILLAITLANGREFGADAASSTLLALAALTAFVVVYAWAAYRTGPLVSVLIGWAAYFIGVAILSFLPQQPLFGLVVAGLSFWIGLKAVPVPTGRHLKPVSPPWWDLPMRALAALALVLTISGAAAALGPQLSGLLTPFPIITCVLGVFTHAQGGPVHVTVLVRSFLAGFYSYASFCFMVAITLDHMAIAPSYLLATAVCLAVQYVAFRITGR